MPTLYSTDLSPPCRAVLLTAKALGIDLKIKEINLLKMDNLNPKFLEMNPQHSVPTLDDSGYIFWDSHAINAYLVQKYGADDTLYPTDVKQRALVDQRLHFDSGSVYPFVHRIIDKFNRIYHFNLKSHAENTAERTDLLRMCTYDARQCTNISVFISRIHAEFVHIPTQVLLFLLGRKATISHLCVKYLTAHGSMKYVLKIKNTGLRLSVFHYAAILKLIKFLGIKTIPDEQANDINDMYKLFETLLIGNKWVAGERITIADFSLVTSITSLDTLVPLTPEKYPSITKWITRCQALPYYDINKKGLADFKEFIQILMSLN